MRKIETEVFTYDELSDAAKEKARDWWRNESAGDSYYAENIIEYAKTIAALMGWNIENIGCSGFSYQGDGAHFTGTMGYAKGCAKAVKNYAPQDTELQRIAAAWQELQRMNFYALRAAVKHSGRYQHEMCTSFDCEDYRDSRGYLNTPETEDSIKEIGRDFMRWIYKILESAYDYENSDDVIAKNIEANECEFTADGEII